MPNRPVAHPSIAESASRIADPRFPCVTQRDIAHNGSRNPMLAVHGVASEARQYSGVQVDGEWHCPFLARAAGGTDAA